MNKKRNVALKMANAEQKKELLHLAGQTRQKQLILNKITSSADGMKKEKEYRVQNLTHLRITECYWGKKNDFVDLINSVWPLSKLTHCILIGNSVNCDLTIVFQ